MLLESKIVIEYTEHRKSINQIAKEYKLSWNKVKQILVCNNISIIRKRNQFQNTENTIDENIFSIIDTKDKAYWLGFLYADGTIRTNRNEISLELQEQDLLSVQAFHEFCNNSNIIRKHVVYRNNKQYISYCSSFSSAKVKQDLFRLGCTSQKSLSLVFPNSVQVSDIFLADFIRGYIDGDGYIQYDNQKHRYRIMILGTKEFLQGLLYRTGWNNGSIYQVGNIYRLELGNKTQIFSQLQFLYQNSTQHLLRKYKIYQQAMFLGV